jgi:hypothetical protein
MKQFLSTLSVLAMIFATQLVSAQLVPGPPSSKPPPYHGACLYDICEGDTVFNIERDYRKAVVVAIEKKGTYILRFLDTGGVGGHWGRTDLAATRGCQNRVCVGERVFNINRDYRMTQVVGLQSNGLFVLQFLDTNGVGGNWALTDLAFPYGCGQQFCVGDLALNIQKNYRRVQVIGVEYNGNYVLRFLDTNGVGGNWSDFDLVRAHN